jgi:hypothetical protein
MTFAAWRRVVGAWVIALGCLQSAGAATQVLYDATQAAAPGGTGWLSGVFTGGASQVESAEGNTVTSLVASPLDLSGRGGYSNTFALGGLVNSAFPVLNSANGVRFDFGFRLAQEGHSLNSNRAGFSVILLDSNKHGIELGFQSNRIFAQQDGANLFTAGESNTADASRTGTLAAWSLTLGSSGYTLAQGGKVILSGTLRDYTTAPFPASLAYNNANYLFVGDNTTSAGGVFTISYLAITTPVPELPAFAMLLAGLGVIGIGARRVRRTPR